MRCQEHKLTGILGHGNRPSINWRHRFRNEGKAEPADPSSPENWSGKNKRTGVIEGASLNEEERAAYCRRKRLYVEQVARWREAARAGT